MVGLLLLGVGIITLVGIVVFMKMRYRYSRKGLPPGSMGFPFFGETAKFVTQGASFMKMRRARYVRT